MCYQKGEKRVKLILLAHPIIKATLKRFFKFLSVFSLATFVFAQSQSALANTKAILLEIDGFIGPAKKDYIHKGIEHAVSEQAEFLILRLNTPGGFDKAMRDIIKDILASPIPVVTYVAPPGARAASAGTYIIYASHIAAMAPATNLGAATPVGFDVLGGENPQKEKSTEQKKNIE